MDKLTFSGVSDYNAEGTLAERSPACLALVYAPFVQTDVMPNQVFQCLRVGPGETAFAWVNITGGSAANALAFNFARNLSYSNATPGFTNVVQVAQSSEFGHQYITAFFVGEGISARERDVPNHRHGLEHCRARGRTVRVPADD